jgi:hypothetical protein
MKTNLNARIAVLLLTMVTAPVLGQDSYPAGAIIGSVEIPALHDAAVDNETRTVEPKPVRLYSQPLDRAAVVATIRDRWPFCPSSTDMSKCRPVSLK